MKYKFETKTIGDCCDIIKKSIHPEKGQVYTCFSLPAFDNSNTPEILNGEEIKSSKFVLDENTILFNKLNPKFRRVWNIHSLEKYENTICSTEFLPLKAKANIEQDYLYYYVSSPYFTRLMDGIRTGTSNSQQRIDWKQFLREPINVPSLPIQRKVVSLLRNIDKKIELNNAINNNLEQQAQAYFDELFVVHADPNWSECTLSDIGSVVAGGTPSKSKPEYYADQGIAWITPKDLSVNKSKFISHGENDISELGFYKSSAAKMPAGTILFSSRAPIGYIAIAQNEVTTNQGFKSVIPNENISTAYMYFLLKNLLPTIEGMASGSTFKEISGAAMKSVPTVMPDADTIQLFSSFCEPVFKEQEILEAENHRLSALRDSLLPKLMSGELDVSDIEL